MEAIATKDRITCNTESMQKVFPQVYKEFFSKNQIVVSASGAAYFTGEHLAIYGSMVIGQKLPMRVYIGLEQIPGKESVFGLLQSYDPVQQTWMEDAYQDQQITNQIVSFVKEELARLGINKAYKINYLSEIPTKCGLNFAGAFTSTLACALLLDNKLISRKDLESSSKLILKERLSDETFNKIFRFAWKLDSIMHADASAGTGPFFAMIESQFPAIYFTEKRDGNTADYSTRYPLFLDGQYELIDKIKCWGYRLEELLDINNPKFTWPFYFGLIYSGNIKSSEMTIKWIDSLRGVMTKYGSFGHSIFDKVLNEEERKNVFFYETLVDKDHGYWEHLLQVVNEIGMECLMSLCKLFRKNIENNVMEDFFRSLNRYHNILQFLRITNFGINRIQSHINYTANRYDPGLGGGAKLNGGGKGGDVLFALPYGHFLDSIDNLVLELDASLDRDITLDYASWIDGVRTKGIMIEQHLEEKVYSEYITQGSVVIENHINGQTYTQVVTLDELEEKKESVDIVLDLPNEDVFIGETLLDSKDIPSATTTIKVLLKLLDAKKEISNADLEISSYTEDRNEFQSKIITPFKQAFKKYRKKNIDFKITGTITKFKIKLNSGDLKIMLIKKVV